MRFIPIHFSTPMVQATLEGRKTQARRIIKAIPNNDHFGTNIMDWGLSKHPYRHEGKLFFNVQTDVDDYATFELKEKYKVGNVLWVRESWKPNTIPMGWPYHYKAANDTFSHPEYEKWKPGINMPKAACRLFLQVESVRVERLQDISEEDAKAEGVELNRDGSWHDYLEPERLWQDSAKASFQSLWLKNNEEESWNENPWVWVITFKKIVQPDGFLEIRKENRNSNRSVATKMPNDPNHHPIK